MTDSTDDLLRRLIDGDPSLGIISDASPQHRKRLATAFYIEHESAQEAGVLAYQARLLVQCSLPYRQQPTNEWTRRNGGVTLTIMAPSAIGLPYGAYPRLLLSWVTTEAVRTQSRHIDLKYSLTRFMAELGISSHAKGPQIRRFQDQTRRLFASTITTYRNQLVGDSDYADEVFRYEGFTLADKATLWWTPKRSTVHEVTLTLSEKFYETLTGHPVPLDQRALKALKGSALALDIYSWLLHRLSYLKKPTTIPWELLRIQFGGEYADTKQGRYEFKRTFRAQLAEVLRLYPEAKVTADQQGLTLIPSRLAIHRRLD